MIPKYPNPLIHIMSPKGEPHVYLKFGMTGWNPRLLEPFPSSDDALQALVQIKEELCRIIVDDSEKTIDSRLPHIQRCMTDDWFEKEDTEKGENLLVHVTCAFISPVSLYRLGPYEDRNEALLVLETILQEMEEALLSLGIDSKPAIKRRIVESIKVIT